MLKHIDDNCTGFWRLKHTLQGKLVICERCEAAAPPTDANRLAAIDENYAGVKLRQLTEEGRRKLEGE